MGAASEYVLASKDVEFLTEQVHKYNSTTGDTVLSLLLRAMNFTLGVVGLGPHGLLRLLTSDWDDGFKPPPEALNVSESVLTSALGAYALPKFASVLQMVNLSAEAEQATGFASKLKSQLLKEAWNGQWLRRAWLGPERGWVGDSVGRATKECSQHHSPSLFSQTSSRGNQSKRESLCRRSTSSVVLDGT